MLCYDLSRLETPMGVLVLLGQYLSRKDGEVWCKPEIQVSTATYMDEVVPFIPDLNLGSPQ